MKHYAERDHMAQDAAGNYYSRHVSAMTAEGLHAKSDIAGELAHRDIQIDRLRRSRDFYMKRCEALQAVQNKMRDPERKAVCDILSNGSTSALDPVDRSHEYAQSKEHGGCSQCGYPEWEPWHRREVGANR